MGLLSQPILKAPLTMRWANLHAEIMPRSHRSGEGLAMQGEVQLQQQIHPGSALAASQQADTKGYLEEKWVLCQSCMVRTGWLPNFPNSHSWVYPAKWNGYIQIILLIGTANFLVLLCCSPSPHLELWWAVNMRLWLLQAGSVSVLCGDFHITGIALTTFTNEWLEHTFYLVSYQKPFIVSVTGCAL